MKEADNYDLLHLIVSSNVAQLAQQNLSSLRDTLTPTTTAELIITLNLSFLTSTPSLSASGSQVVINQVFWMSLIAINRSE